MPLGGGEVAELVTVVKKIGFNRMTRLWLSFSEVLDGAFVLSVRVYDRTSGRQAILLDEWFVPMSAMSSRFGYFSGDESDTVGGRVHCRSEISEQLHAKPRLIKAMKGFALDISFSVHVHLEQGGRTHIKNKSAELANPQILDMIQNHLDWK